MGIAAFVASRIFDLLKSRSSAQGGTLSPSDLDLARDQFFLSLLKGASYFEELDRKHMQASKSMAPELLARQSILVTLLIACGHKAARAALPQVESIGEQWFREVFGGIARYIREVACANADQRLMEAYFKLAMKLGGHLRIADLLTDDATRLVLSECLAPLIAKGADEELAQPLSDAVTAHIASKRGIAGSNPAKITAYEMRQFLSFLALEIRIGLDLPPTGSQTQESEQLWGREENHDASTSNPRANFSASAGAS